jgi:hypothetical protein
MPETTKPLEWVGGPLCGRKPHTLTKNEAWYGCVFVILPEDNMVHQYEVAYTLLTPDGLPYLQHTASVRIGNKRRSKSRKE